MKNLIKRLLSSALILALLLQQFPPNVLAVSDDVALPVNESGETAEILNDGRSDNAVITGELEDQRGEYEKHFRLSDGTFIAAEYSMPVHYNENGIWVDIDNTLAYSENTGLYAAENGVTEQAFYPDLQDGTLMEVADDDTAITLSLAEPEDDAGDGTEAEATYESDADAVEDIDADLNSDSDNTDEIEIEEVPEVTAADAEEPATEATEDADESEAAEVDSTVAEALQITAFNHSASIEILNSEGAFCSELQSVTSAEEASDAETEEAAETETKSESETESDGYTPDDVIPDALSNTVIYRDVYPGVDLQYDTVSYSTKESIILNEEAAAAESYSFVFSLDLTGMHPVLNEDGSVTLYKGEDPEDVEEIAYTLPVPFMTDANGDFSDFLYAA